MEQLPVAVQTRVIAAGKFRRYRHLTFWQHFTVPHVVMGNIRDLTRIIHGFFQSLWIVVRFRPDVVFAKGGYVCLPLGIAAWLLQVPLVIHDSDTRPGLTNRVLARFARSIATGSPLENYPYDAHKSTYTGVPIDSSFHPMTPTEQVALKRKIGVDAADFLVVATGGGLGSASINHACIEAARSLAEQPIAFYDIAGAKNFAVAEEQGRGLAKLQIVNFVYDGMANILGAADIVVARGSATFLQELAGLHKPTIVIPARQLGDQVQNAVMYEKADAALVLSDAELMEGKLADVIMTLLHDEPRRQLLATNLGSFARPEASQHLATLIEQAAKRS